MQVRDFLVVGLADILGICVELALDRGVGAGSLAGERVLDLEFRLPAGSFATALLRELVAAPS